MKDVLDDWKLQVRIMCDEELKDDRSAWMRSSRRWGREDDSLKYDYEIHTLAIELEQLRRFGEIYYDTDGKKIKEGLYKEVDSEKVSKSFSYFVLSQLSDEELESHLMKFRDVFRNLLLVKSRQDIPVNSKDDEIVNQHKNNEINKEVEQSAERGVRDLQMMIDKLRLNKNDWVRYLGL